LRYPGTPMPNTSCSVNAFKERNTYSTWLFVWFEWKNHNN
jgi:hypothetical protein